MLLLVFFHHGPDFSAKSHGVPNFSTDRDSDIEPDCPPDFQTRHDLATF
jgi:hypothetical protein